MASNIERLTITDTFTNWRDKINLLIDVAVLAPMADEDGIMHIDVPHCNAREVRFGVPVRLDSDVWAKELNCEGSFFSSVTATTIQETAAAGLTLTGTEGYIPWVSGQTQNGTASMWTSSYDDSIHFSYVNVSGELINTFSWNPETNVISAMVETASNAEVAAMAESIQVNNLSDSPIPGSYPLIFGSVDGDTATGSWDESLIYNPRNKTLSTSIFKGNLDGNAKTASKADKLTEKRTISLGTDASGEVLFDGSEDVVLPCKLAATGVVPNLYGPTSNVNVPRTNRRFTVPAFRVDEKGRITQAFTRTVEFPFPEVDIDTELDETSGNPVANRTISQKISEIEGILENTPSNDVATAASDGLMSRADKIKLNSLTQLPRISSIGIQNYNPVDDSVSSADAKTLSTSRTTSVTVNAKGGLTAALALQDTSSGSELSMNLSMNLEGIAGSGLQEVDGKLTASSYSGATASASGTSGMVPAATSEERNLFLNGAGQWASPVGTTYDAATTSTAGLMSAADKTKLDGIAAQASKVSITRSLTSGTKIGTITINGTATDLYGEKNTDTTYSTFGAATSSAAGTNGLVPAPPKGAQSKFLRGDKSWVAAYDSAQIDDKLALKANLESPSFSGTPTVPNVSTIGASTTQIANTAFVTTAVNNLKGSGCPTGLDTLKEIAASIGNNTNFKKYVDDGLAGKLSTTSANYIKTLTLSGKTLSGTKGDGTPFSFTTVDTNTTYSNFVKSGSTAAAGLVPKPSTTAGSTKYLCENGTWSVPAMNADEKVKNTLNTTAKAYITGTTSASTSTGGQVFDTGVFLTTAAGTLQATKFVGALQGNATTATTLQTARTINGVSFNGSKNITVADSTKLPLTGGTLTGNLVIKKGASYIYLQNTSMTKGSKPSSNQYSLIALTSSAGNANGNRIGLFQSSLNTAGNVTTGIYAYRNTKDATTNAAVSVTYEAGGTAYANCPTPPANDSSTKIATTAWVNSNAAKSMVPSAKPASRSSGTTYTAATNGFIIVRTTKYDGNCTKGESVTVNGYTFTFQTSSYGKGSCAQRVFFSVPCKKGWTYKGNTDWIVWVSAS